MKPAPSVIIFTTASGAGCGLLVATGTHVATGLLPGGASVALQSTTLAIVLIIIGLVSSTRHLGHPERMFLALQRWRSSWLAREALAALATIVTAGLSIGTMTLAGHHGGLWVWSCAAAAMLAAATLVCTAMIYSSLQAVPQWHDALVVPSYMLLSVMTGLLLLALFADSNVALRVSTAPAIVAALLTKTMYWRDINHLRPRSNTGTVTGLGRLGNVRMIDPPLTEDDFTIHQMNAGIAAGTAHRLRLVAVMLLYIFPLVLTLFPRVIGGFTSAIAAVASVAAGFLLERWLFFAEARHTSMLARGELNRTTDNWGDTK
jgi:DMSO reductase anchor subunit